MYTRTRVINGREYHQVVESYRTPAGPRQRVLASYRGVRFGKKVTLDDALRSAEIELAFCESMVRACDNALSDPVPYQPDWCRWTCPAELEGRVTIDFPRSSSSIAGRRKVPTMKRERQEYARRAERARVRLELMREAKTGLP